ncbi:PfkB family carbohydrate kinase [Spirochaeta isovalerica]|uniref:Sugar/nucleoside kinase (Ribokinase family) n=1 Tax=Spirochaeta isovalerica TaxID=150 RepID=A0A841RA64_9SPIO|nr:PfkB family carbohydrate kinase [Spirochaeta isovalerica]MBB6482264.1 sugar/nucleoside kinase (ribokinase family) [Spirochaeta isovalerica]
MSSRINIYKNINELSDKIDTIKSRLAAPHKKFSGICGFDGFIDTFIRMEDPSSMADFGPRVSAAAGIAASYRVKHKGDKFGGNGPLFAGALSDIFRREIELSYIGGIGKDEVSPIFRKALEDKVDNIYTLADPAHSDCLEFTDGKIMLNDLSSCAEITWERLREVMGMEKLDEKLSRADYIGAVNWGKLVNVGEIWENISLRLTELQVPAKKVHFFMDLAEFEQRPEKDIKGLLDLLVLITEQSTSILSFNLKEAWEMGDFLGKDFRGKKDPESAAELAAFIKANVTADKVVIHPNDGAVCSGEEETVYVPGPYCREPLISTGAGDNFGAGCLAASLKGLDDTGMILAGVCSSGHFVRSGESPTFEQMVNLIDCWQKGEIPERL